MAEIYRHAEHQGGRHVARFPTKEEAVGVPPDPAILGLVPRAAETDADIGRQRRAGSEEGHDRLPVEQHLGENRVRAVAMKPVADEAEQAALLKRLMNEEEGREIVEFKVVTHDLEDLFLQITEGIVQ